MRTPVLVIMSLLAAQLTKPCSFADSKPGRKPAVSFSVPFILGTEGRRGRGLADPFSPGLSVVLVGKGGICSANTGEGFTEEHSSESFEATYLTGADQCLSVGKTGHWFNSFQIAVVRAAPMAVRLVSPKDDKSSVPEAIASKARSLASSPLEREAQEKSNERRTSARLSPTAPKVLRFGNVTLLTFTLQLDGYDWEPGPTVLVKNGRVFLLKGACTYGPIIAFRVNDKPYLTYSATVHCCGCGDTNFFVYDLSNGAPKLVYTNSHFSN